MGGLGYLGELAKNTPSVANIKAYAQIVRQRATLRQLIGISTEIADSAFNPEGRSAEEILDDADQEAPAQYAKLAQRFITWMTSHTSAGILFDIDTALPRTTRRSLMVQNLTRRIAREVLNGSSQLASTLHQRPTSCLNR